MFIDKRSLILERLMLAAPFDGFGVYALQEAAKQSGVDKKELAHLFPKGLADAIRFFYLQENQTLTQAFSGDKLTGMRVPEKIQTLILARLSHWYTNREGIKRLVSYQALPWNFSVSLQHVYESVDTLWRIAGDTATDFNFYTKRLSLAAVYSATLLFWLEDNSPQQEETALFLKRRLNDIATLGKYTKKAKECLR